MDKPISNFKLRLQEYMDEHGYTQTDVANATGIPKSTLSKYLSGKQDPKTSKIEAVAKTYNLDYAWLLGYDVPQERADIDFLLEGKPFVIETKNKTTQARLLTYASKLGKLSDTDRTMIESMIDRLIGGDSDEK